MKNKQIYFIINPAAGRQEPIDEVIRQIFADSGIGFEIHILNDADDIGGIVRQAVQKAGLITVYGGDGTVTRVAAGVVGTDIPLAVIPGGTANVFSKELGMPQNTRDALQLLRDGRFELRNIDTGLVNGNFFLLRVNLGIMANMVIDTDPEVKKMIGQLAYGITTIQSIQEAEPVHYKLNIDGKVVEIESVSLTITNSGNAGIGDLQLQHGISMNDGLLDIISLKDASILSVIKVAGSSLFDVDTDAVEHWTGKEIIVTLSREQQYLCDDCEAQANELIIKVVPSSLTVVVPVP